MTAVGAPHRHRRPLGRTRGKALLQRLPALGRLQGLLPLAVVLGIWEVAGSSQSPYFPPPSTWSSGLTELSDGGTLGPAVAATLRTFALGLGAATVVGAVLGVVVGRSVAADRALGPTLEFARAMPPAVLVPIATLLLGYDETMKVSVVTLASLWAIVLNTRSGVQRIDQTLLEVARSLQLGTADRLRKVIVPALLPSLFLGVRVAAPIAVVITLLVEILTYVDGVGALIAQSQRTFQPDRVYALIVVAGLLSLMVNVVLGAVERYVFRYHPAVAARGS